MAVRQLSIFLENETGRLADLTEILAENGIDLRAISIAETADYGILRLIVDDAQKATAILNHHGYLLSMTPVLVIAVPDRPGGLSEVLAVLAEEHVDVEYMYSLFAHQEGKAYMVMRIHDEPRFLGALGDRKIKIMTKAELNLK